MEVALVLPLVVVVLVAAAAGVARRWLPPRTAARLMSVAVACVLVAALPTLAVVAVAYLAHVPVVGVGFRWCAMAMGMHGSVSPWLGWPVVAVLVAGAAETARVVRRHRRLCRTVVVGSVSTVAGCVVEVADDDRAYAVTLPGRSGRVVLSRGLLDVLDDDELAVVVAHETAHGRFRHDRYLLAMAVAGALLPPIRLLTSRVRHSLERWADEAAARACGDRRLVADTVGRVALLGLTTSRSRPEMSPHLAGFAPLGVVDRVDSMLHPPARPRPRWLVGSLWIAVALAGVTAVLQVHHLETLVAVLCRH